MHNRLHDLYRVLRDHFGPTGWWPADSSFEVIAGAILTQNTAWKNVEKALANLAGLRALTPEGLWNLPESTLRDAVRPAGYFNQKSKRLRGFLQVLFDEFEGSLELLFELPTDALRHRLLRISGIGPETADSILLYAAERPVFVIDTYTVRILTRHGILSEEVTYEEAQQYMMDHLPLDVPLYKEYHALLVYTGKDFCRPKPVCQGCPLEDSL